ncbi:MAG: hypothetical protein ACOC4M_16200 [Promethearchaeia archaeon]
MKEVRIVSLDSRGRIVIPSIMRKSLGITSDSQLMLIGDSEKKEIRITPAGIDREHEQIKYKITIKDSPGSLGKIATAFGNIGVSLVYGEAVIIEKNKTAVWTVIGPKPTDLSLEQIKKRLISEGEAIKVETEQLE